MITSKISRSSSDSSSLIATRVQILCFKFPLNPLRFSLARETDTKLTTAKSKQREIAKPSKMLDEKLKTKGLMFFVSFLSCDLQDFKF